MGERQQRRQKGKIRDALNSTCSRLNNIGLALKSVELGTTSRETVHLQIAEEEHLENNDHHSNEGDQIKDITYLMLRHGVSLNFYHELAARFKDLPRAYKVYIHIQIKTLIHTYYSYACSYTYKLYIHQ